MFTEPPERIVALAYVLAMSDFPKVNDILAIARIESRFVTKARNGVSRGIMQVNHGPWEVGANMQAGVNLLHEYYLLLGSERAAVIAYNSGPKNYRLGKFNIKYWNMYKGVKDEYSTWLQELELGPDVADSDCSGSSDRGGNSLPGYRDSRRQLLCQNRKASLGGDGRQGDQGDPQHQDPREPREELGTMTPQG